MAAKRREPQHLSEPGLEDELEYASEKPPRRMRATESDLSSRNNGDSWRVKTHVPLSIPYTTPASEFLYGTSAIFAALTAMRRKMYKLYVYSGENREAGGKSDSIQVLAHNRQVEVIKVEGDWLRVMDKLSKGRPHNVCQLAEFPSCLPLGQLSELTWSRALSWRHHHCRSCLLSHLNVFPVQLKNFSVFPWTINPPRRKE
jgi:21S rRNA (GM2251-2'-O)-methyltransferase